MNDFKESLKVKRDEFGKFEKISITEPLKSLLIQLMMGNITKKELMEKAQIGDKLTVELKINEIVDKNPELKPLYDEYIARKREDFSGYQFRAEAIEMIRKDYSQSAMAKKIGVSRRSFSLKMKQLQEKNSDNILGQLLKQHAERKLRKLPISHQELLTINLELDEYEEQYPVGLARYEKRNPLEVRRENLQNVVSLVEGLRAEGISLSQMSDRKIISEANFRRYRLELEALLKVLDDKQEKEQ